MSLRAIDVPGTRRKCRQGNPNKAIAKKLFITVATVNSHFVQIFSKLEVAERTAAVTEAVKKEGH